MQTGLGLDAAKTFFNNPACRLFFAFSGAHSHHGSDSPIHGKDVQPERPFFSVAGHLQIRILYILGKLCQLSDIQS